MYLVNWSICRSHGARVALAEQARQKMAANLSRKLPRADDFAVSNRSYRFRDLDRARSFMAQLRQEAAEKGEDVVVGIAEQPDRTAPTEQLGLFSCLPVQLTPEHSKRRR